MPSTTTSPPFEREQLLERLANLRTILPVFAQELATSRRQAARLRTENERLLARVQRLERERRSNRRGAPEPRAADPAALA